MTRLLEKIFSIKNSDDKSHKVVTLIGFKLKFQRPYKKSYALNSGERQVGTNINDIRKDNINRYELAINVIKQQIPNINNLKGLDVFCGNGYGSWLIANKIGAFVDSIDGSKEAVECAKKCYGHININHLHKLFPFRLKKNRYDFIVSLESIEHVKDDILFLNRLYSALKQNGILIISTPNMEKQDLTRNINHFYYRHYYNEEFISLAQKIGFKFVELYGQDTYIFNEDKIMCGMLKPEDMGLKKDYNGQFTVYVLKKEF